MNGTGKIKKGPKRERAPLILASASPRRKKLLEEAEVEFQVEAPSFAETVVPGRPAATARLNARGKARAAARRRPDAVVLAADTVVFRKRILGKPASADEARRMLENLSGGTHRVYTAVAAAFPGETKIAAAVAVSRVRMKKFGPATISAYLRRVDTSDKAGAYAIQEHGRMLVEGVKGSISNVVGLPLETLAALLRRRRPGDAARLTRAARGLGGLNRTFSR